MRDKKDILQRLFEVYVIVVLLWVIFALSFDIAMILLHFFNPELQIQLLKQIR
jgi:hypothetical protein